MLVVEPLQVHLVEVDHGRRIVEHLRRAVAVGDVGAPGPRRAPPEDRHRPFAGDQRLVVVLATTGAPSLGRADDLLRRDSRRRAPPPVAQRLGRHPVLAIVRGDAIRQVGVVAVNLEIIDVSLVRLAAH